MAKHKRSDDESAQEKADSFDKQWQDSYDRGEEKRDQGLYPYDLDNKTEDK